MESNSNKVSSNNSSKGIRVVAKIYYCIILFLKKKKDHINIKKIIYIRLYKFDNSFFLKYRYRL